MYDVIFFALDSSKIISRRDLALNIIILVMGQGFPILECRVIYLS